MPHVKLVCVLYIGWFTYPVGSLPQPLALFGLAELVGHLPQFAARLGPDRVLVAGGGAGVGKNTSLVSGVKMSRRFMFVKE